MVELSVLIVTYDSAGEIGACLDAVLEQKLDGEMEVVVVDNASTDDTVSVLERYGNDIVVIRNPKNEGYAAGVNSAFAASTGRFVALVNPDCAPDTGTLAHLRTHLETNAGVGVAAAMLRYEDDRHQDFARRELDLPGSLLTFTDIGQWIDQRWRDGRAMAARRYEGELTADLSEPLSVDCPAAACVVAWRKLLEPRPMDPGLPLVFNDAELYRRIRRKAYRIEVVPDAGAVHLYGASLRRVPKPRMRAEFVASLRRYVAPWTAWKRVLLWLGLATDGAAGIASTAIRKGGSTTPARGRARGTLGGLGLPGGVKPWLAPAPSVKSGIRSTVRLARGAPRRTGRSWMRRARRRWFIARLRLAGLWVGSKVRVEVHPTAEIAWRQILEIKARRPISVTVGEGATIREGVTLRLGGRLDVGAYSDLRWDVTLNVNGHLVLEGRDALGRGTAVHVDGTMRFEWGVIAGEYCTIVDTNHDVDGSLLHPHDQANPQADITVGAASFIGAHSVITAGCTVGAGAVIGANSVVTRDIPPGVIAAGIPARPIKGLPFGPGTAPDP